MMLLIGLNDVAIKPRSLLVAARFTEVDEAFVSDQGDPLAGELSRRHACGSALELPQIIVKRGIAALSRINSLCVNAHILEPLSDQPVMLCFIADLPREC